MTLKGSTKSTGGQYPSDYFELDDPKIDIPDEMTIVAYIPPGTIFNAISGAKIQGKIHTELDRDKLFTMRQCESFLKTLRDKISLRTTTEHATNGRLFFSFGYSEDNLKEEYPKTYNKNSEHDIYDYKLTGPKDLLQKTTFEEKGFKWGVHKSTSVNAKVSKMEAYDVGHNTTLSAVLKTIKSAQKGFDKQVVHLIFCRVEILGQSAKDGLDAGLQTDSLYFCSYSGI